MIATVTQRYLVNDHKVYPIHMPRDVVWACVYIYEGTQQWPKLVRGKDIAGPNYDDYWTRCNEMYENRQYNHSQSKDR